MCKAEILVSQGRGKDKIDFDQTCSPSFFFDPEEVIALSPRKLGIKKRLFLAFVQL